VFTRQSLVIVCAAGVIWAAYGSASAYSGNELYRDCDPTNNDLFLQGRCFGYVSGIIAGVAYGAYGEASRRNLGKLMYKPFCIPDNVTQGQFVNVISNYLQDNPQIRHWDAGLLVTAAAIKHFPCP
jgi:hypothetical protein